MKGHDLWNDMYPSKADKNKSISIARNAAIVSQVLSGDYSNVKDGMKIDITGTSSEQYETIKNAFQKVVNASENNVKTLYLVRQIDTE